MSEIIIPATPPQIRAAAKQVTENLLPPKSVKKYLTSYNSFMKWCENEKVTSFTENVFLAYFNHLSKTLAPTTLWSRFSMLKHTLIVKKNINIDTFHQLIALLKRKSDGYYGKKSLVLTDNNIQNFLNHAPDEIYLSTKVNITKYITSNVQSYRHPNLSTLINSHQSTGWLNFRNPWSLSARRDYKPHYK